MPRKGPAPKRPVIADPVYSSPVVSQLVNKILLDGKKDLAQRIVYGALAVVESKSAGDPVVALKKALDNIRPTIEVKSRRVAARPTRCRSRSSRTARTPSRCAGS